MRDIWYGDNKDLVKWAVLFGLAKKAAADRILQVAYWRPSTFPQVQLDNQGLDISPEVIRHLRNIHNITSLHSSVRITVIDSEFNDRDEYLRSVLSHISGLRGERCVVFLDPDTGLEPPGGADPKHVLESEAAAIWQGLKPDDIFAFYQYQTNMAGQPWIEPKQEQLAESLGIQQDAIKVGCAFSIAREVVIFYATKH
jgi:hypothetical protein